MNADVINSTQNSSKWGFGLAVIFTLLYWALGLSLIFVIPAFSDMFDVFGAVPKITRFVLESRLLIGISLLILYYAQMTYLIFGYFKALKSAVMKPFYIKFIALILLGIALAIALIGILYLPILNLDLPILNIKPA